MPGRAELHGRALDALGDPNRRAIVDILARGERSVRELADEVPISRPAVSRHLRVLKDAGLVSDEADGTRRIYRLRGEGVEAIRSYFEEVWAEAIPRVRLVAENRAETENRAGNESRAGDKSRAGDENRAGAENRPGRRP